MRWRSFLDQPFDHLPSQLGRTVATGVVMAPSDITPLVAHDTAQITSICKDKFIAQRRSDVSVVVFSGDGGMITREGAEFLDHEVPQIQRMPPRGGYDRGQ